MPTEPFLFAEANPQRNAMLKVLEDEFGGCGIIYITIDLKAGINATWSMRIPPLAIAGYLKSIAADIENQAQSNRNLT